MGGRVASRAAPAQSGQTDNDSNLIRMYDPSALSQLRMTILVFLLLFRGNVTERYAYAKNQYGFLLVFSIFFLNKNT